MMKKLIHILCLFLFTQLTLQAQNRKELLLQANNAYEKGDFGLSVYYFRKLAEGSSAKDNDQKIYARHRLAESYRQLRDYHNAEAFYALAVENKNDSFPDARYYYGLVLMNNGKYAEAEKQFDTYLTESNGTLKLLAEKQKTGCAFALDPENNHEAVKAFELDTSFNKGEAALGVIYFTDYSIAFACAPSEKAVKDPKTGLYRYTTDLYISSANDEGNGWDMPVHLEGPMNSNLSEAPGAMGADRKTFYFTRWNPQYKNDCSIYVSKMFNHRWMDPMKIEGINKEGFRTMQPNLAADETRLYFVSDRPGGQGGLDIWFASIDSEGNLGEPQNMGAPINTAGDETTPFYHSSSQTLFFSSNGQAGFGGLDVYKTHFSEEEQAWGTPINLGAPINSSTDDDHYIIDREQVSGFFTSDRTSCISSKSQDIKPNCLKVYGFNQTPLHFVLSGHVYDAETEKAIPNARVALKDVRGAAGPFFVTTDEQGYYHTDIGQDREFFLKAQKSRYFADAAAVKTIGLSESADQEQDFFLRPIQQEEIEIPGIDYELDRPAMLKPGSKQVLDTLFAFLTLNNDLVVEINSHTDCRGNDVSNQKLSQERAQSCVDYLVSKGIKKERLIARGKGETEPVPGYECATIEKLKTSNPVKYNEMHQRNRRTAYQVVSDGAVSNPIRQGGR